MKKKYKLILIAVLAILLPVALLVLATDSEITDDNYGIFSSQDATTVVMNGDIDSNIGRYWDNYIAAFPDTKKLIMKNVPGSTDDEANLSVARKVRAANIAIHLPADSEIASGGVDFYFAGTTRTRDAGSKLGVHAWGEDGNKKATDYPKGHENHQQYIDYYVEMGLSQKEAEDFYYFTINSAPAESIHWMTDSEIEQYKLTTIQETQ